MASAARDQGDPFDLTRFTSAQDAVYDRALAEIRNGDKRSHWMWLLSPYLGLSYQLVVTIASVRPSRRLELFP